MSVGTPDRRALAGTGARRVAGLALAALLLHLVLIQPNHPEAMTLRALFLFPLELPALLLALVALPAAGRLSRAVLGALVAVLLALVVLKLADLGMFIAFNRGFNPVIDMGLVGSGWTLARGAIGTGPALLALAAGLLALAGLALGLWHGLAAWVRIRPGRGLHAAATLGAGAAALVATAEIGQAMGAWRLPVQAPGAAFTARVGVERAVLYRATLADLAEFHRAARTDPFAGAEPLFDRLAGRDLLLIFVESYGRTSFVTPAYAATHVPTLRAAEPALAAAGMALRSGWLTSPISGGQSWLAHGTLAAGLATGTQSRYGAMLASPRRTLFHLARAAGYETVAVMPAITLPWPEAAALGFDRVLRAADLGYRGQPFNWVTMPDQYTLDAWEARLPPRAGPRLVQIALISSHAPWVPVPEMIRWEDVGDGTVFDRWATSGDPPEVVWRDSDRVRDQYRQAVDYALQAVTSYAARLGGAQAPLIVVLGDHQPAGFVSGMASQDVPAHLIGPPEVLELFAGWGWTEGMVPAPDLPALPMGAFRDRLVRSVSSAAAPEPPA